MVSLHCESQAAQALGAPFGQVAAHVIGGRRGSSLEPVDGVVHLRRHAGAALRVIVLALGEHEVPGELGGRDGRPHGALPRRRAVLAPRAREEQDDKENGQRQDDGQNDPAPGRR